MFDTERKKEIARRIKELRTSRKLSHQKLATELKNKYDITISVDSLKQYEVDDEFHTKWDKVQGMNIKYLYCIADFFNVSVDYLLVNTNDKTPNMDLRAVCDFTGLCQRAIQGIVFLTKDGRSVDKEYTDCLNFLLGKNDLMRLIMAITQYKNCVELKNKPFEPNAFTPKPQNIEEREYYSLFHAQKIFTEFVEQYAKKDGENNVSL